MANEKLRYSDQELEEFRAIIDEKLRWQSRLIMIAWLS